MLYTTRQISMIINVSVNTIAKRIQKLGIGPSSKNGSNYLYTETDLVNISNFRFRKIINPELDIGKVIYVHTTYHIYESKINFMEV